MVIVNRQVGEYIRSDLHRYAGDSSPTQLLRHLLGNRSFRYSFWFRLCRVQSPLVRFMARAMHRHLSNKYGIFIPSSTQVGYGLYIGHGVGLVVNHTARIGNNCNLSQFTTIGSNHEHAACIGDNVYVGPGVSIVENVVIGSNATIGAGSVVVHDVPEGSTVAGNPAKVVSNKSPGRYVGNRWPGIAPAAAVQETRAAPTPQ
jgi:serine O-acetyltransferase